MAKLATETNMATVMKRVMDVVGSIVGLILFSPFFITIPLIIKITSPGPVLFRQERVGQFGRRFTFLKFRSMHMNNDDRIHREFLKQFISGGKVTTAEDGDAAPVFKITNDPRITSFGRFIRKSSLDELPQFINVLKGDMSLVGPRPPIPYEFEDYDIWHRYRLLKMKPGITGLWQVTGRSTTTFDSMVRLDINYIKNWSLWLDIKILCLTPFAVFKCRGAY
ncbi:MAG: UDP-phosphate galactose phosphotransferase [Geobacter sp.]|nr:MAG: UDP-phosphate galactose phosphotransferase [Geobacter sp.]